MITEEPSVDVYWTSYLMMTALAAISSQETVIWDRDGEPSRLVTGPEGTVHMSDNKPVKRIGLVKVKVQAEITLTQRYWCILKSTGE